MKPRMVLAVAALAAGLGACAAPGEGPAPVLAVAAAPHPQGNTPPAIDELAQAKQFFRARDFGLAEKHFRSVIEGAPDNAEAWFGLAAVYDEMRRFDLADRAYRQAARSGGTSVALLNNRGYSNILRGRYREARRDLVAAQAREPQNPFVAANLRLIDERGRNAGL